MSAFVHPANHAPLEHDGNSLRDSAGNRFPVIGGVPRFCEIDNYTASFGKQWNQFEKTQIDGEGGAPDISRKRFFAETGWDWCQRAAEGWRHEPATDCLSRF